MCIVCTDTVSASDAFALHCGHMFCNSCWGQHVESQIEENKVRAPELVALACPCAPPPRLQLRWHAMSEAGVA